VSRRIRFSVGVGASQGQGARRGKEGGGDERRIPVRVVPAAGISAAAVLVLVVELAQHDGGDKARKHAQPHRLMHGQQCPPASDPLFDLVLPQQLCGIRRLLWRKQLEVVCRFRWRSLLGRCARDGQQAKHRRSDARHESPGQGVTVSVPFCTFAPWIEQK